MVIYTLQIPYRLELSIPLLELQIICVEPSFDWQYPIRWKIWFSFGT